MNYSEYYAFNKNFKEIKINRRSKLTQIHNFN